MRGGDFRKTSAGTFADNLDIVAQRRFLIPRAIISIYLPLLVALAGGCTPWRVYKANGYLVGPNYCRPQADVSDRWIDADDQRLSSEEPDLTHWWTTFDDPKLNCLIQTAVQQNLSLREAGFRILQSRGEFGHSNGLAVSANAASLRNLFTRGH